MIRWLCDARLATLRRCIRALAVELICVRSENISMWLGTLMNRGLTTIRPQFNFLRNPRSFAFIRGHFPRVPRGPFLVPACPA